jgi:hypothetical protein
MNEYMPTDYIYNPIKYLLGKGKDMKKILHNGNRGYVISAKIHGEDHMTIPPMHLDGMTWTKTDIENNITNTIALRDAALDQNNFEYAVSLSHTIALLNHLLSHTE